MFGRLKLFQLLQSQPTRAQLRAEARGPSPRDLEMEKLRSVNEELRLELEMTDDLLTDAANVARRYENALIDTRQTIAGINTPNGTLRRINRLTNEALGVTAARTIDQIPAGELFVVSTPGA
jgi:hypothetical protein